MAIVALGVGFYSGLQMCKPDMIDTADEYLQEHNFYDYQIQSSYGIDDESVKLAKKAEGVADAEVGIEQDIIVDTSGKDEVILKAISIPKNINTLKLCHGRLPEKANECVVDNYHLSNAEYQIGKTIKIADSNKKKDRDNFAVKEFTVVGSVNSPLYLDYERGSTSIGNGSLDTYFYVSEDAFDMDVATQLYIKLKGNEYSFSEELENKLDKYEDPMDVLAENITAARRESIRREAQEEVDDARAEYNKGLSKYNSNKNKTYRTIKKTRKDIKDGLKIIPAKKKELKNTIADLKEKKTQLEYAIAMGMGDVEQMKGQLIQVKSGIKQAQQGITTLNNREKQAEKGLRTLDKQEKRADREFAKAKNKLNKAKREIDDAQQEIDDLEKGDSYSFSREDNLGYSTFDENATIVKNIAKIFPAFFFLVAALVCMTTMTRMIDEQRSQIGILKALGYSNGAVLSKYMFYSGSAATIGAVAGFFVGCRVFPSVIWHAYTMMYDFNEDINFMNDWKLGCGCLAVALICSMGATWISCAADFKVVPAQLIRPKAPKAGKRILLERVTPIWNRISFLYKVSFRNIFRYKKRFLMMVLGVSGCTALLIAGMGIDTTVKGVAKFQYNEVIMYDYQMIFDKDMSASDQNKFLEFADRKTENHGDILFVHSGTADFEHGNSSSEITLVASDSNRITDNVKLHYKDEAVDYPGEGEVAICRKLQHQYGTQIGDTITLKKDYKTMNAKVSAVYDNYIGETMYMTESTYKNGFGESPEIKTAYVIAPDSSSSEQIRREATALGKYDDCAATVVNQDMIDRVDSMMKSLNAIVYVVILCAGLLAFIVLYNLTNINIVERIREIATIKVLGFYQLETSQYVFRENIFLTAIAAVVGIPLGKWLLDFVVSNINVNMIFFVSRITWQNYIWAVVMTFIFAFVVNLAMQPRLRKVSMTESLKSIE